MQAIVSRMTLAGALALALASCSPPASEAPGVDRQAIASEVESKVASIIAAVNADDVEGTIQFNAPDYEFYSHGLPNVVGAAVARANIEAMLADPAIRLAVGKARIDVAQSGDMAVYFRALYLGLFRSGDRQGHARAGQLDPDLQAARRRLAQGLARDRIGYAARRVTG